MARSQGIRQLSIIKIGLSFTNLKFYSNLTGQWVNLTNMIDIDSVCDAMIL